MLADFYRRRVLVQRDSPPAIDKAASLSFLVGLGVSVPFMSSTLYTGPIAQALHGADLTFYVGFVVSASMYWLLSRPRKIA